MTHSFNVELAIRFGVEKAIIIQHFLFWIAKNRANRKNYHEGRYWTYCSSSALAELFPYMTPKVVWLRVNELVKDGFLLKENFNATRMDRTCWYAFSDSAESILRDGKMDFPISENGFSQPGKPIPDTIEDIDIDNKENRVKESAKKFVKPTVEQVSAYIREKGYHVDAEAFVAHYESNGWRVGSNPMKDWHAALVTWEKKEKEKPTKERRYGSNDTRRYNLFATNSEADFADIESDI